MHADPLIESDLLIEVENKPGALATVAAAVSDAGVNISAATCTRPGDTARLHILVKHPEAAKHALATAGVTVTSQREVVVVDADDRPGVLADLARMVAAAGIDLDLLYLATKTRIVFGSPDLDGLRRAFGVSPASEHPG
ncbi:MAG TPA: ACT domain-containing protein [Acidimicrobiales bacterium]|nr:ACT domain-containing protein [Acidimicrobiales bacterium]